MQLNELCLHPKELKTLESLTRSMPHAVLLIADNGFGKATIAQALADKITDAKRHLQLFIEPLPDTRSVTIEQARSVKAFFRLKTNDSSECRVVIIDKADSMTTEAQNSLLKILEEPPTNCYLILNSSRPGTLLETIRSRTTMHPLVPPAKEELVSFLKSKKYPQKEIDQALALGGTLVGLVVSILSKQNTESVQSVLDAKKILGLSTLERLKMVDKLAKDKPRTIPLLEAMKILAEAVIVSSAESGKPINKWATILRSANDGITQLDKNASPKLVLTNLFLSI